MMDENARAGAAGSEYIVVYPARSAARFFLHCNGGIQPSESYGRDPGQRRLDLPQASAAGTREVTPRARRASHKRRDHGLELTGHLRSCCNPIVGRHRIAGTAIDEPLRCTEGLPDGTSSVERPIHAEFSYGGVTRRISDALVEPGS
jgi:hypothetical protein